MPESDHAIKEIADVAADRIDAGLVVGAAVGVHQRFEQRQHGAMLAAEPLEDFLFAAVRLCGHVHPSMSIRHTLKTSMTKE